MIRQRRINWVLCVLCFCFQSALANFPREELVPGGVSLIPLAEGKNGMVPKVSLRGHPVALVANPKDPHKPWLAVVGIPLIDTHHGLHLKVYNGVQHYQKPISVTQKAYRTEKLTLKGKKKGVSPEIEARVADERAQMHHAFQSWNKADISSFKLQKPVKGRISGYYGSRRIINGEMRDPHRGIDFAAPIGTPVKAAAAGKVVLVANHLLTGISVVLDHGQGFKTVYCHLDKAKVKPGVHLKAGQILGTVGKTGRATGPHLHFGVNLNNERVSPELFF